MTEKPLYRRVLLKASGEALMGEQGFGIDVSVVDRIAADIAEARALGVEVGVVIGGGNIFRGVAVASKGGDRVIGDHMGMLATVINSLALRTSLVKIGVDAVVLSAIAMPEICESFSQRQATAYMNEGRVVIFAGGTGNPFFTTDFGSGAAGGGNRRRRAFQRHPGGRRLFRRPQARSERRPLRSHHPSRRHHPRPGHHGHCRDRSCARKPHSDNRLLDPREGRLRRDFEGRGPLHHRRRLRCGGSGRSGRMEGEEEDEQRR